MPVADPNPILLERAPHAVVLIDVDGKVTHANREACRTLAMREDQLTGRPILGVVLPEDRDRVKELYLRVLGGQEREWTARFRRGDGVTRVQWVRAVPIERDGAVDGIVVFTRDVTETRAGRPDTLQLQTLLENLPGQLVLVLDNSGQVRYASGLSRTHFIDDADAIGRPFEEFVAPDEENERLLSLMLHEVVEGHDWGGTLWHRRMDGMSFPVRTYASPYRDSRSGRVLGTLLVGRDVSLEQSWRERAARAHRLAGIGTLAAGVANRLSDSFARLEAGLGTGSADDIQWTADPATELAEARGYATALAQLADDLPFDRRRISLRVELADALEERAGWLAAHGVAPTVRAPDVMPTVYADPAQIRRVLDVLVENAVEGCPTAEAPCVLITLDTTPTGVSVQVTDTCSRVDAEVVHRIFEPFFTTKERHVGLGLAVARGIVEAHGGRIRAEPGPEGRGLTIVFEIPFEDPDATLRFRPAPLTLLRARSVLVVDDEDAVRRGVRRFLEKVGFEVREAWSGRSALAQITAGTPPELVITDLKMSDGSGSWLLDELSRDFPDLLRHTVVLTGDADAVEADRLVRNTGCPILRKPVELPHLLDVLDEVARRS